MADHHDPVDPEQQCTAVFGIIHEFRDATHNGGNQFPEQLIAPSTGELFLQQRQHHIAKSLAGFEYEIADEPVADDYIHLAPDYLFRLDIADEVQTAGEEELMRSLVSSLPLLASSPMLNKPTRGDGASSIQEA